MGTLWTVLTIVAVVGIMIAVLGALFEMGPLWRHRDQYRDKSGHFVGSSPRLD